ncbi:MAG TPA: PilW family protein, partial [Telluria sp.]|nr:PilW family protein [Telluria sp.]
QSGYGLNDPLLAGCNTVFADTQGYALAPATRAGAPITPLGAAIIESNGTAPDRITLYAGSSMSGTGTLRVTSDYTGGTLINVDRIPYGFSQDDVIVVAPETLGGNCALAQISAVVSPASPGQQSLLVAAGGHNRFNTGALGATFSGGKTRLFNLGQYDKLSFHSWSVADGFLQLRATDLAGAGAAPSTVIDNVVSIKAQYGFDTRVGTGFQPQGGNQVAQWSPTMIDADSDGTAGSAGDYQRIAAIRIAVVARSKAPEKPDASGACSATTVLPTVFATASPSNVAAVPMTVDVTVAGDPISWKCYRYRVFETIVPLRNASWRP